MIVRALTHEIEQYADRLHRESRLLAAAREGKVTKEVIVAYLSGVLFMLHKTPVHLQRAAESAREVGRPDLAAFYAHKQDEERDHDQWVLDDFAELRRLFGAAAAQAPHPSMTALAGLIEGAIERAPASYLAYILLAEYFTVLVGPTWLTALEERCGIPRHALSVVAKHVELDQDHVQEAMREADALITPDDLPAMDDVLKRSIACYDAFYASLADLASATDAARATA
jgi:pyrroloquinoline quinone (PQQ) biosynthesis protein C